jgi:4-aminobutyrate aminotransferase-like enzyme
MRDKGILLSTDGPLHDVIKIKPPLVFGRSDAQHFLSQLHLALTEL